MKNKFSGKCFVYNCEVQKGQGWFQSVGSLRNDVKKKHTGQKYHGKRVLRCTSCKGKLNKSDY